MNDLFRIKGKCPACESVGEHLVVTNIKGVVLFCEFCHKIWRWNGEDCETECV